MQAGEFLVLPPGTEMTWARAPADTPLWLTHGPTPFWLFLPWGQRLPRHDEDLREPLVRRQGSQVSMRVAKKEETHVYI